MKNLLLGEKNGPKIGTKSNTAPSDAAVKTNNMITVFYDGQCGLCSKEINHYRKIAPAGIFDWQDITRSDQSLKQSGITLVEGLKLLHAKDDNNQIHIGVDAFILIWKQLKKWHLLALFISLPIIRQMVNITYQLFAHWRFKRLKHCQLAAKEEEGLFKK